jgi:two-component system cell cycle response regulator
MLSRLHQDALLASHEPAVLALFETLLTARGSHVDIALSARDALTLLSGPAEFALVLLDAHLPGMDLDRLLAEIHDATSSRPPAIVLISDTVSQDVLSRLAEGVIHDVIPRSVAPDFLGIRLDSAMRVRHLAAELETRTESTVMKIFHDPLTGAYNRETILSLLFRETDRVQRVKSELCVILFDINGFDHWTSRLSAETCDELSCEIAARTNRLLRSYDLLGRVGKHEFLIGLPGCDNLSAAMLAERIRRDVFGEPYKVAGESIRLSACFGISSSNGRSPLVVIREAELALAAARSEGAEPIQSANGEELLVW